MKIILDIPKDFEKHFNNDRFKDSLKRIEADVHDCINETAQNVPAISGNYELELVDMLIEAFKNAETKETTEALNKLEDKLDQAYSDAVNDAQNYWNPRVAQDALQDAYNNVSCWIDEIFNGSEDSEER